MTPPELRASEGAAGRHTEGRAISDADFGPRIAERGQGRAA